VLVVRSKVGVLGGTYTTSSPNAPIAHCSSAAEVAAAPMARIRSNTVAIGRDRDDTRPLGRIGRSGSESTAASRSAAGMPLRNCAAAVAPAEVPTTRSASAVRSRPASARPAMNAFTDAELNYLDHQPLMRFATASPSGKPDVAPVIFSIEGDDIVTAGFDVTHTVRYRNISANPRATVVVDDLASVDPWSSRLAMVTWVRDGVCAGGRAASPLPLRRGFRVSNVRGH
jgi:PPOX class F420-dependent enzyme/OxyR family protein